MMSTKISPATLADAEAISELVNSAYRGETGKQGWTTESDFITGTRTHVDVIASTLKTPGHQILKYVDGGELLGCVEIHKEGHKLYLGMLTVRPSLQGKGLGKKLMAAAEQEAKQQQCTSIFMTVISIRKELIDWYKRHGYAETGERKPFAFTDPRFGTPTKPLEFIVLQKQLPTL